jgi:hypothetical protein
VNTDVTSPDVLLARYFDSDANFVLVVSGSFEANSTKKLIEIVYDLLIETIQLGSVVMFPFGVGPVGLILDSGKGRAGLKVQISFSCRLRQPWPYQ